MHFRPCSYVRFHKSSVITVFKCRRANEETVESLSGWSRHTQVRGRGVTSPLPSRLLARFCFFFGDVKTWIRGWPGSTEWVNCLLTLQRWWRDNFRHRLKFDPRVARLQTASCEQTSFSSEGWAQTKSRLKFKPGICYTDTQPIRLKIKDREQRICNNLTGIRLQRQTPPKRLHSWPRDFLRELVCGLFFLLFVSTSHCFHRYKLRPRPQDIFSCWSAHMWMTRWGEVRRFSHSATWNASKKNTFP